jgi:hypothetical protein
VAQGAFLGEERNVFSRMRNKLIAGAVVVVVLGVGWAFLAARAAAGTVSLESEQATLAGGVAVITDINASGGKAVQFSTGQTTPPPPGGGTANSTLKPYGLGFTPFAYVPWSGSVAADQAASGAKNIVAAFILATGNTCTPAWDGDSSMGLAGARSTTIASDIAKVRTNGGDALISFGGQAGTELAIGCTNTANLTAAYRSVIDKFGLTKIDFDVEGSGLSNVAANTRRADALVTLQREKPNLKVWVTLPVEQSGLPAEAKAMVALMKAKGVVISGVNIMVMDYGTGVTQMGQAAINAANATFSQLKSIYTTNTDAEIWKSIGLTAMIGINDTKPETFTLANAKEMHDFAVQKGIGMTSYWNTARDKACAGNAATLSDSCSGVTQTAWQFAKALYIAPTN